MSLKLDRSVFPGVPAGAGLIPISRPERGPEAEDTRQRVVPPVAAGVLVAGFGFDTGVIGTQRS